MFSGSVRSDLDGSCLAMSRESCEKLGCPEKVQLHYGQFSKGMLISVDSAVEPEKILVPANLSPDFVIPDLPFEVRLEGQDLHLGPVIGFMNNILFYDNPDWIKTRFAKYNEIKGLIIIFSPCHVDTKHKLIRGIYYDPGSDAFKEVTAPYPAVIYSRTDPPIELYRYFKAQLGARNYYNYPFRNNKWQFWRCACKYPGVMQHIPETRECTIQSVHDMLRKHGTVYLKPYTLSRGRGIYRLSSGEEGYLLSDTYGGTWTLKNNSALEQLLQERVRRNYLVQQEVPFELGGHKLDYRIYLQKNKEKLWKFRAMDARLAVKNSIISNLRNRYDTLPGEEGIQKAYGLDEKRARKKIAEIANVCVTALRALEGNGHSLGDVAIDLVLDKNQKVWLLEVQPDYSAEIFKIRKEYYAATIHPHSFDYAKGLAGF